MKASVSAVQSFAWILIPNAVLFMNTSTVFVTTKSISQFFRCNRESAGPSFLVILGDKYGFRPLPASIPEDEYKRIIDSAEEKILIEDMYALDANCVPPMYVLKRRDAEDGDWWQRSQKCQEALKKAAKDALGEELAEKYFVSITETEINHGLNKEHKRVVIMKRLLGNVRQQRHLHRHMIDMKNGVVDELAQEQLRTLKRESVKEGLAASDDVVLEFDYPEDKDKKVWWLFSG